jgi:hypothetical protein
MIMAEGYLPACAKKTVRTSVRLTIVLAAV